MPFSVEFRTHECSPTDKGLSAAEVEELVEQLDGPVSMPLNQPEKSLLATIAQATLEVEGQRRSLDLCGLRYLTSLRIFVNQSRRMVSGTATPASGQTSSNGLPKRLSRLSFRNIAWASHSDSQEILLSAALQCCGNGKMLWDDAQKFGVFLWLKSPDVVVSFAGRVRTKLMRAAITYGGSRS